MYKYQYRPAQPAWGGPCCPTVLLQFSSSSPTFPHSSPRTVGELSEHCWGTPTVLADLSENCQSPAVLPQFSDSSPTVLGEL